MAMHGAGKAKEDEASVLVLERMLKSRTILLSSDVSPTTARRIIEHLLFLESEDPEEPITLIVNSPGGDVHSGFAIYDVIRFIQPRVRIVCSGITASIATVILLSVDKEDRLAMPNARLLLHQPLFHSEIFGPASDLEITANEIIKTKELINALISSETGQPLKKVTKDTERDFWLSAQDAKDYGLVSGIVRKRSDM